MTGTLTDEFTSTGSKLFFHQEALQALRDGSGKPIHAWLAAHDICNHKCTFCSVGEREGDTLSFNVIKPYFETLAELGLKAVTLSGGGNPILYRCKETGADFNDLVEFLWCLGLQIGCITNGMPMKRYYPPDASLPFAAPRESYEWERNIPSRLSWKVVHPDTLDKLTWCRISMSGLDHNHKEQEVFVPDFDPSKTTLGFSWIMSDSYEEPTHKHGWVSTPEDVRTPGGRFVSALDRMPWIEAQIARYVRLHNPAYVRLLCNCLEPQKIPERHEMLSQMALRIDPNIVFSQNKPPRQPKKCFKVLPHPCLNADGWVYPCDSVVLNKTAGHKFNSAWRICRAEQIRELYEDPSRFTMPDGICPGCVFADQVDLIHDIVGGMETAASGPVPQHVAFV